GVSLGIRRSGSSAGSPGGSEPSGSSRAARWPCMRYALTSAIAAATPPKSSSSAAGGAAAGMGAGAAAAAAPLPPSRRSSFSSRRTSPGCVASSSLSPLSKSARHSAGTESGFSRYSSSSWPAKPAFSASTSLVLTVPLYQPDAGVPLVQRVFGQHRDRHPDDEADRGDDHRDERQAAVAGSHPRRDQGEDHRERDQLDGLIGEGDRTRDDRDHREEVGGGLGWTLVGACGRRGHGCLAYVRAARAAGRGRRTGEPFGPGRRR